MFKIGNRAQVVQLKKRSQGADCILRRKVSLFRLLHYAGTVRASPADVGRQAVRLVEASGAKRSVKIIVFLSKVLDSYESGLASVGALAG